MLVIVSRSRIDDAVIVESGYSTYLIQPNKDRVKTTMQRYQEWSPINWPCIVYPAFTATKSMQDNCELNLRMPPVVKESH